MNASKTILVAVLTVGSVGVAASSVLACHGGSGYGGGYHGGGYNQGYYAGGYNRNYYDHDHHDDDHKYGGGHHEKHHEVHCYCSHKSCGCKPGHPKGGCYCEGGAHRH